MYNAVQLNSAKTILAKNAPAWSPKQKKNRNFVNKFDYSQISAYFLPFQTWQENLCINFHEILIFPIALFFMGYLEFPLEYDNFLMKIALGTFIFPWEYEFPIGNCLIPIVFWNITGYNRTREIARVRL